MSFIPWEKLRGITLAKFEKAFRVSDFGTSEKGILVHPGLPSSDSVTLWYARKRETKPEDVKVLAEVSLGGQLLLPARFVHQTFDNVGRVRINGLACDTRHAVTLVFGPGDERSTITVRTSPAPTASKAFSFLAYSCFAPFAGSGKCATRQRTLRVLKLLEKRSLQEPPDGPSFALAMGDQVYVDEDVISLCPPQRAFLFGLHSQHRRYAHESGEDAAGSFFEALYEAYFRLPPYQKVLRAIPHLMMWDDHDIRDGWGSQEDECRWVPHLDAARRAFFAYQFLRNPAPAAYPDLDSSKDTDWVKRCEELLALKQAATERPELHFGFQWGAAAHFLVLDLRSKRNATSSRVISTEQMAAVGNWLSSGQAAPGKPRVPRLYVLVSSMPVTHEPPGILGRLGWIWFRRDDRLDSWWSESACHQRDELLRLLRDHFRRHPDDRLLILSGDVHFAEVLSLSLPDDGDRVFGHEVISSGLAQSSYHRLGRAGTQRDFRVAGLSSKSAGARLFSPHFAEIFVGEGSRTKAPRVDVVFYPATKNGCNQLVNPVSRWGELSADPGNGGPRLELAVGPGRFTRLRNFDRFMLRDSAASRQLAWRWGLLAIVIALLLLATSVWLLTPAEPCCDGYVRTLRRAFSLF